MTHNALINDGTEIKRVMNKLAIVTCNKKTHVYGSIYLFFVGSCEIRDDRPRYKKCFSLVFYLIKNEYVQFS